MNMKIVGKIFASAVALAAVSFGSIRLYDTLSLRICAGENARELRSVIRHFRHDKAKHKAAEYLIDNLRYHYSYEPEAYDSYCSSLDSLFLCRHDLETTYAEAEKIMRRSALSLRFVSDARNISASFLIRHIDEAFAEWHEGQYLQHLNFEEFCEYVLPYKAVPGQPWSDWKEDAKIPEDSESVIMAQMSSLGNSVRFGYHHINDYLIENGLKDNETRPDISPHLHPVTMLDAPYGDCQERAFLQMMYCRANGLPCSVDFVPNWMSTQGSHYWLNLVMTTRVNEAFESFAPRNEISYFLRKDLRMPKVFRMTWKPHIVLKDAISHGYSLPWSLSNIFVKDVTDEYCRTSDISIKTDAKERYLFLAVFDNERWVPVDITRRKGRKADFQKVGNGGTYCVVKYDDGIIEQASEPFYVGLNGVIHVFSADNEKRDDITVDRKYPSRQHIYDIRTELRGGILESSVNPGSEEWIRQGECADSEILSGKMKIADTSAYRYWRMHCSPGMLTDIAEIYFYEKGTCKRLMPEICGDYKTYPASHYYEAEHIIDNDPLTFTRLKDDIRFRSISFDFGHPVILDHVSYLKRGDGNDVTPGDTYELYYNDGKRWVLHDRMTADDIFLDFHGVPRGALLHLKCISRGREHRVFTWHEDRIVWR